VCVRARADELPDVLHRCSIGCTRKIKGEI
jgi:hypothetical protein